MNHRRQSKARVILDNEVLIAQPLAGYALCHHRHLVSGSGRTLVMRAGKLGYMAVWMFLAHLLSGNR